MQNLQAKNRQGLGGNLLQKMQPKKGFKKGLCVLLEKEKQTEELKWLNGICYFTDWWATA
jgi:hypothetical protein